MSPQYSENHEPSDILILTLRQDTGTIMNAKISLIQMKMSQKKKCFYVLVMCADNLGFL